MRLGAYSIINTVSICQNKKGNKVKMADIIVLSGRMNSGKTTTMRRLLDRVRRLPNVVVHLEDINPAEDFIAVIEINGIRIGFISNGDYLEIFADQFGMINNSNIDVLICASRSRNTENSVYNFLFENLPQGNRVVLCLSTFPTNNLDMMSNNISQAILSYLNEMYF